MLAGIYRRVRADEHAAHGEGKILIATLQPDPSDGGLLDLRERLAEKVGQHRSRGVIVDVTALDVIDSYGVRMLRGLAHTTRLRGAETVIVGIQPEVAMAMVHLGMTLERVATGLDLEDGLEELGLKARA